MSSTTYPEGMTGYSPPDPAIDTWRLRLDAGPLEAQYHFQAAVDLVPPPPVHSSVDHTAVAWPFKPGAPEAPEMSFEAPIYTDISWPAPHRELWPDADAYATDDLQLSHQHEEQIPLQQPCVPLGEEAYSPVSSSSSDCWPGDSSPSSSSSAAPASSVSSMSPAADRRQTRSPGMAWPPPSSSPPSPSAAEQWSCDVCGKTYKSQGDLKKHKVYHNRPIKCPRAKCDDPRAQCLETFATNKMLKRHIKVRHSGDKRDEFPCPVCLKAFTRDDNVDKHLRKYHPDALEARLAEKRKKKRQRQDH